VRNNRSHTISDKVRIKHPGQKGERGVIDAVREDGVMVKTVSGKIVALDFKEITNFSLAARKAWKSMPKRKVGRPRGSSLSNRISVTLRIDEDLWREFRHAEAMGLISNRTETLNEWIRQRLAQIANVKKRAS
jgi:uncharacterized protein (DUF4415 family)